MTVLSPDRCPQSGKGQKTSDDSFFDGEIAILVWQAQTWDW